MSFRQALLLILSIGTIGGLAACGPPGLPSLSLNTPPPPPPSVLFLIAPPTSLAVNAQATVNAAVTNDSTAEVAWSATCGSAGACGSFTYTQTPGGFNNTYVAPAAIPSGTTVTATATLVGDSTKFISALITITPPLPIVVSFSGYPASLQISAAALFSAQIVNDVSPNPQIKWTVTCPSSPCGSFNPINTTNEAPTTYTAPAAIPSGNIVTVTATSVTDPTKSVSANVTITKLAPTLANGTYVFQVSGPVGGGSNSISGVITALNGAIASGEQDYVSYAIDVNAGQPAYLFDPITGGSYATTPDGNLQVTLKTSDINVGFNGVETLNGVIVSSSRVLITSLNSYIANGTLDLQTSKPAPSGGYAFSTFGVDLYGQPAGIAGILNVDSAGGISGTGSILDINDNFIASGAQPLGTSAVSGPDTLGRVVFQLLPPTPSAFQSLYLAGYIIDANQIRLVETSGDLFQGVMGGRAVSQDSNKGNFSDSSIAGSSYVFGVAGQAANAPLQVAGVFTANANGNLTGTLNWNDLTGATAQSPIAFTGSYTVDPTGRATLSHLTDNANTFNYQLQLYLTGSGEGLLLSGNNGQMIAGRGLQQQTASFTAASLSGSYGLNVTQITNSFAVAGADAAVGPIMALAGTATDTLTGFVDFGNGSPDFPVSGTMTAATNGVFTGTLFGLNAASYTTPDNFTLYLVDSSTSVLIETDNTQLTLGYLELQQ
jgi:hypothetical protein